MATALAVCVIGASALASGLAPQRSARIAATWSCCGAGGAAVQYWKVAESGGGSLSGTAYTSATVFASITGHVTGRKLTLVTKYNSFSPGYVATFVGRIRIGGRRMSGTWSSNRGQRGTWSAVRGKAPKIPRG